MEHIKPGNYWGTNALALRGCAWHSLVADRVGGIDLECAKGKLLCHVGMVESSSTFTRDMTDVAYVGVAAFASIRLSLQPALGFQWVPYAPPIIQRLRTSLSIG